MVGKKGSCMQIIVFLFILVCLLNSELWLPLLVIGLIVLTIRNLVG